MIEDPYPLDAYSQSGLASAEGALFAAWEALEKFHDDLVVVGGLAVHYHTRDTKNPLLPATATLDVDFGISLGADAGMAGTVLFDLTQLGYTENEKGRMTKKTAGGNLYIDFLTEHPARKSGAVNVSDIGASVCPGINRALADRKWIEIKGVDRFEDPRTYRVPICGIGPLLVLKLNAFGKRPGEKKAKDAYDLLVAVSSYSEGAMAAIAAFHHEGLNENPAFEFAVQTLREHFTKADGDGPIQAVKFRFGQVDPRDEGSRLKEDLVTIALELLNFK